MIYSRWRPDTGLYDYFDSPTERIGMGDDLPVPLLPSDSPIGVASTEVGRTPRGATRFIGSGDTAKGVILPLSRAGLGAAVSVSIPFLGWIAAAVFAGWWIGKKWKWP